MNQEELERILKEAKKSGEPANLRGEDLAGLDFRNFDLSGADMREADLRGSDMTGADLTGADMRDSYLQRADMTGADLIFTNLRRANLKEVNMSDVNLSGTDLSKADVLHNINLANAKFDYPVYRYSVVGGEGIDVIYFPEQEIIFVGVFKGSLEEGIAAFGAFDEPINSERLAIIEHFKNLESIKKENKKL